MHYLTNALLTFCLFIGFACGGTTPHSDAAPITHTIWDKLTKKYVSATGMVNYKGFKQDQAELKQYLDLLRANAPNEKTWTKDQQLAYWINAYNAFTVDLILQYYPLKSIKDIGASIKIPFVNTPWDIKFIQIGGEKLDLNNIEHGIIRKKFSEPRIHFALVCAAMSCPPLRHEAYTAEKLNEQLDDQGRKFLNDPGKNKITRSAAELSKILDWYGGDFKKKAPILDWINKYSTTRIDRETPISYKTYNWALNEQ